MIAECPPWLLSVPLPLDSVLSDNESTHVPSGCSLRSALVEPKGGVKVLKTGGITLESANGAPTQKKAVGAGKYERSKFGHGWDDSDGIGCF
jgi:hypothetical protein